MRLGTLLDFLTPKMPPRGYFWPTKNFTILFLNCQDTKTQCWKKIFEKIFLTHPTKPLAAILYFGELGEKFNAQRKNIFGASKLGQKTTFKRYPFLKLRRLFHPSYEWEYL